MFAVALVALGLLGLPTSSFALSNRPENTWVTNGPVYAIAPAGGTVYIGGSFTQVGPRTGPGAGVNPVTGTNAHFPVVSGGEVHFAVPDGAGGFFIGGSFTHVGRMARRRLAHILADRRLDRRFRPHVPGSLRISAMSARAGMVYLAGSTGRRTVVAAIDARTGATRWQIHARGRIYALEATAHLLYMGGAMQSVSGHMRQQLAAVKTSTGRVSSWNPGASTGPVRALALRHRVLFVGGRFTEVAGRPRWHLAAFDTRTGKLTRWRVGEDGVNSLSVSGRTLYVGTIHDVEALDAVTGASRWRDDNIERYDNPGYVSEVAAAPGTVYVGGLFDQVGGNSRNGAAALDAATGQVETWNPDPNFPRVHAVAVSKDAVYLGGHFNSLGGVSRDGLAAIDASTGRATSWDPNTGLGAGDCDPQDVLSIAVSGSTVYVGGCFSQIDGEARNDIAALDAVSGQPTSWNPDAHGPVYALVVSGSTIYAGGAFTEIGGQSRNKIAALDASTGQATSWDPNVGRPGCRPYVDAVDAIAVSSGVVYAGGCFRQIGGQRRANLAALDPTTGEATSWRPDPNGSVDSVAVSGDTIYAGGQFSRVGGRSRTGLAAIRASTGTVTAWHPELLSAHKKPVQGPSWPVHSLALSGHTIYDAGQFNRVGKKVRMGGLAGISARTGRATPWDPYGEPPDTSGALAIGSDGTLYVGGYCGFGCGTEPDFLAFAPGRK